MNRLGIDDSLRNAYDHSDATMVAKLHLLLSAVAMITLFVDPAATARIPPMAWVVFLGFIVHSLTLYGMAHFQRDFSFSKLVHWLDVLWIALIVYMTGANHSYFFLFFVFAILVAAFRWGFDEAARVTLAAAALYCLTLFATNNASEVLRVLLRSAFMLSLGYMVAHWGESLLAQQRRLGLLRVVSLLSNPRFGIDQTIVRIMQGTRLHFNASNCVLILHQPGSSEWNMRSMRASGDGKLVTIAMAAELAHSLMRFGAGQLIFHSRPLAAPLPWTGESVAYETEAGKWLSQPGELGEHVADLLGARSYISVPIATHTREGRVFMISDEHRFERTDALFLAQVVAQVSPVIENIDLLDRMASEAAQNERERIAHDLHDSTVQPYIGLSHTVSALRNKAAADNPLIEDIERLAAMASQVVGDLRRFASNFKHGEPASNEPVFLSAVRRQLERAGEFYDIKMGLQVDGELHLADRLAAAVYQLVSEGLSNIRKHTRARTGSVHLACANGWLDIDIENDGADEELDFVPVSITGRCTALGGTVRIEHRAPDSTLVHIRIPL